MRPTALKASPAARPPPIAPSTTTTSIASPALATTGRSQSFGYDATGNLLSKIDLTGGTQTNYTFTIAPTSNRMTGITSLGIGYSFDAAGNRTGDGRITYVYNHRGRMNQVRIINGAVTNTYNYLINGVNLRVRKTGPSTVVPQGVRIFVYDDAARLIGEYDDLRQSAHRARMA